MSHPNSTAGKLARANEMADLFCKEQHQRAECAVHILTTNRTRHQLMLMLDNLVQSGDVTTEHALNVQRFHNEVVHHMDLNRITERHRTLQQRVDGALIAATRWEGEADRLIAGGSHASTAARRERTLRTTASMLRSIARTVIEEHTK